ncbi:Retrovirus-related Pol polyprotein from transposon TNT 1-94 [Rhizoctonia solani]|uniref:Retrovirus-related Pol polyprotein from transposon TNT 1-94 n=1 Tax=Rhizoctonia solani TaxID=456999 RepID=A0A8H8P6X3_9AGAM|nr:Retrovirus-related Pol polyprotein from transposon TNT 1-94 [Rhizoctonia solani]QRW26380.1 Retrovirus-related Pol polyprotein from transposon TNT 1-94 [Rhizoctonia solani]
MQAVMKSMLHVPKLNANLMSVKELTNGGTNVLFCKVFGAILISNQGHGQEIVKHTKVMAHTAIVEPNSTNNWDNIKAKEFVVYKYVLDRAKKGAVKGMEIIGSRTLLHTPCKLCLEGKQTRSLFSPSESCSSKVLELLHSNLHGPVVVEGIVQEQVQKNFEDLKASVKNLTGKKIKALRTDGGGKHCAKTFEEWMHSKGIEHQKTKADSLESNGIAEQGIETMNNFQQCMRADANLPDKYWGFAIVYAAYLWNVTPKVFLNGQTPKEMFSGQMHNIAQLQRFGCTAWVQVPDKQWTKLQDQSIKCTYIGFTSNQKAHTLLHRESGKLITSQDVVFDEGGGICQHVVLESCGENPLPKEEGNNKSKAEVKTNNKDKADNKKDNAPKPVSVRQSSQSRCPPVWYRANVGAEYAWLANTNAILEALNAALPAPPKTFAKAMSWPDGPMWLASMTKELDLIEKHGMGKKVGRPTSKNVTTSLFIPLDLPNFPNIFTFFTDLLPSLFQSRDLGKPKVFVGVKIDQDQDAGTLKILQGQYIKEILS